MPEIILDLSVFDYEIANHVAEALRVVQGVEEIRPANEDTAQGTHKGLGADLVLKLVDKGLPEVARRVAAALRELFNLSGMPGAGEITFGTPHGPAKLTYDPRKVSLEEAVAQMLRLLDHTKPSTGL